MVQLYVSQGPGVECKQLPAGVAGSGLSEDVAEHYKQLIRVQDLQTAWRTLKDVLSHLQAFRLNYGAI